MNMMAEKTEEVIDDKQFVLGPSNRCDSCSAEALVWAKGVAGELMFCGHHYAKNEKALKDFAYEIVDEREKIIENKLIGEAHA